MSHAQVFQPENRLAKTINAADAVTAQEMIASAEGKIAKMADELKQYVRSKLPVILAFATADELVVFSECRSLQAAALAVAEVAGGAGMGAIGEIARGIYAMVDNLNATGSLHVEALRVHIKSLAIVCQGDGGRTPDNEIVLNRLAVMRRAIGVKD
jgi:hypothetical protein